MSTIAIDCRKANDFGIGTYIRGLIRELARLDGDERYLLIGGREALDVLPDGDRIAKIAIGARGYSVAELFSFGWKIRGLKADLFHFPHYVVPFFASPFVVTIHDLIHLHEFAWTRSPVRRGYAEMMIGRAVAKSRRIFTVSNAVGAEIRDHYPEAANKIATTPNGIDDSFFMRADSSLLGRFGVETGRYFLFVGNDKPHKNLEKLVAAFESARPGMAGQTLVIAGSAAERYRSREGIVPAGYVSDEELRALYGGATALVMPSREEGFGLPVAEAMAAGCPVITSTHPALEEVAGDAAMRCDASSTDSIAEALRRAATDDAWRRASVAAGRARAAEMRWRRSAEQTLAAYRGAMKR